MKRLKIYLDTSILNFIFADDSPIEKEATIKFLKEVKDKKHDVFISTLVLDEIADAPPAKRDNMIAAIKEYKITICEIALEVEELAQKYMNHSIFPQKFYEDALHVAAGVINNADIILSWNMSHIVKHKTRVMVNGINKIMGFRELDICTPLEVIGND